MSDTPELASASEILIDLCRAVVDLTVEVKRQSRFLETIANVQVEMLDMAKKRGVASPQRPAASAVQSEPQPQQQQQGKNPKGEVFTTTGVVEKCYQKMDGDGNPRKTARGGAIYAMKLENGFQSNFFSETQFKLLLNARDSRRIVIVEYTKTEDGKYTNLESVKLIAAAKPEQKQPDGWDAMFDDGKTAAVPAEAPKSGAAKW